VLTKGQGKAKLGDKPSNRGQSTGACLQKVPNFLKGPGERKRNKYADGFKGTRKAHETISGKNKKSRESRGGRERENRTGETADARAAGACRMDSVVASEKKEC